MLSEPTQILLRGRMSQKYLGASFHEAKFMLVGQYALRRAPHLVCWHYQTKSCVFVVGNNRMEVNRRYD